MNTAIDNFGLHKTLKRGLQFMVHTMDTLPDEFLKKIKNFYAKPLQEKNRFISEPYPKDGKGQAAVLDIYQLCQSMPGTTQGQAGTSRDKAGTIRDKQGHSLSVPACPYVSLSVHSCPCLSMYVPVCLCLTLYVFTFALPS